MAVEYDGENVEKGGSKVHHVEDIVIVGGGIGGLGFAAALHKVGLKAVVLEQSDKLRAEGTSITLWSNAFRVLEILDLADQFRSTYLNIPRFEVFNDSGQQLTSLDFTECKGGPHDLRVVERKVLLEALAGQVPQGTIQFNSRVMGFKKSQTSDFTDLELQDGSTYSAKVVVAFDGANSMTGSWMGLETPKAVGEFNIRGMAVFPDGHNFREVWPLYLGTGIRMAIAPMTSTKVYYFIIWAGSESEDSQNMTPEEVKHKALELTKVFQTPLPHLCVNNTPLEHFTKNILRQRLNTRPSDSQVKGNVTVAGDASHPTSPDLGQGGCMALEDGIILTQKLHQALVLHKSISQEESPDEKITCESERIHKALLDFHAERHGRTYSLTHQAGMARQRWNSPDSVAQAVHSARKSIPMQIFTSTSKNSKCSLIAANMLGWPNSLV